MESGAARAAPAKGLQRLPQNPTYTHIERTEGGKAQRLLTRFIALTFKLVKYNPTILEAASQQWILVNRWKSVRATWLLPFRDADSPRPGSSNLPLRWYSKNLMEILYIRNHTVVTSAA